MTLSRRHAHLAQSAPRAHSPVEPVREPVRKTPPPPVEDEPPVEDPGKEEELHALVVNLERVRERFANGSCTKQELLDAEAACKG